MLVLRPSVFCFVFVAMRRVVLFFFLLVLPRALCIFFSLGPAPPMDDRFFKGLLLRFVVVRFVESCIFVIFCS